LEASQRQLHALQSEQGAERAIHSQDRYDWSTSLAQHQTHLQKLETEVDRHIGERDAAVAVQQELKVALEISRSSSQGDSGHSRDQTSGSDSGRDKFSDTLSYTLSRTQNEVSELRARLEVSVNSCFDVAADLQDSQESLENLNQQYSALQQSHSELTKAKSPLNTSGPSERVTTALGQLNCVVGSLSVEHSVREVIDVNFMDLLSDLLGLDDFDSLSRGCGYKLLTCLQHQGFAINAFQAPSEAVQRGKAKTKLNQQTAKNAKTSQVLTAELSKVLKQAFGIRPLISDLRGFMKRLTLKNISDDTRRSTLVKLEAEIALWLEHDAQRTLLLSRFVMSTARDLMVGATAWPEPRSTQDTTEEVQRLTALTITLQQRLDAPAPAAALDQTPEIQRLMAQNDILQKCLDTTASSLTPELEQVPLSVHQTRVKTLEGQILELQQESHFPPVDVASQQTLEKEIQLNSELTHTVALLQAQVQRSQTTIQNLSVPSPASEPILGDQSKRIAHLRQLLEEQALTLDRESAHHAETRRSDAALCRDFQYQLDETKDRLDASQQQHQTALDRAVRSATTVEQDAGQHRYDALHRDLSESRQDTQDQLERTRKLNCLISDLRLRVEQLWTAEQALIEQVSHFECEINQLKHNQQQLEDSHILALQLQFQDQKHECQRQVHESEESSAQALEQQTQELNELHTQHLEEQEECSAKALEQQLQDLDGLHSQDLQEKLRLQALTNTQQAAAVLDTHQAESTQSAAAILLLQTQLQTAQQVTSAVAAAPVSRYARQRKPPPVARPSAGLLFTPNDSGSADSQSAARKPPHHFRRPSQRSSTDLLGRAWLANENSLDPGVPKATAYYLGPDLYGIPVVAEYANDGSCELLSLWQLLDEADSAGSWVWCASRQWVALLDTNVTEDSLRQFEHLAAVHIPELSSHGLLSVLSDTSNPSPWPDSGCDSDSAEDSDDSQSNAPGFLDRHNRRCSRALPQVQIGSTLTASVGGGEHSAVGRHQVNGVLTSLSGDALLLRCALTDSSNGYLLVLARQIVGFVPDAPATPRFHGAPPQHARRSPLFSPSQNAVPPKSDRSGPHLSSMSRQDSASTKISLTPKENKTISGIELNLRKSNVHISPNWEGADLQKASVLSTLRTVHEFILTGLRGAEPPLSEMAVAYTVWKIMSPNRMCQQQISASFITNDRDDAVAFSEPLPTDEWLQAVFLRLTGVNYNKRSRERAMESMGLPDFWKYGSAKTLVDAFVNIQNETELQTKTWAEAWSTVGLLLRSTGFGDILKELEGPINSFYQAAILPDGLNFWPRVQEAVIHRLEGPEGLYAHWIKYTTACLDSKAKAYSGSYASDFLEVAWRKRPVSRPVATPTYVRNRPPTRQLAPPPAATGRINAASQIDYVSKEEALPHRWECCQYHLDKILNDPKNTLTEDDLRSALHPNGACLNLNNVYLFSTLHPGGGEELLRRRDLREPERKQLWDEQRDVVDRLRKAQQPANGPDELNMIVESEEGRICVNIDSGDGVILYTLDDGRSCF
jgi:Fe-S-cluster formation regulator IscX/YfhJ